MNARITLFFLALAASNAIVTMAEQGSDPWLQFENGKALYREGRFDAALNVFKDLGVARKKAFDAAQADLAAALASEAVREIMRATSPTSRDSLSRLIRSLAERELLPTEMEHVFGSTEAGDNHGAIRRIITELYTRKLSVPLKDLVEALRTFLLVRSTSALGDSIVALKAQLTQLREFPEAEYWIGLTFAAEGEYGLAAIQFERADAGRAALETPEEMYTVLYSMADLHKAAGHTADYERMLVRIAADDPLFADSGKSAIRDRMADILVDKSFNDSFDRLLRLYRVKSTFATAALDKLGTFYLESRRENKAVLYLGAAANATASALLAALEREDPSYAYNGLSNLLSHAHRNAELAEYIEESGLYRLLYSLGDALYLSSARKSAISLWSILAADDDAGIWRIKARARLLKP